MYLRNCWYVAAWPSEVGPTPLSRTFLDEPVVLFRTAEGRAVALEDRCCHRNLPLSMGRIEGDNLRCGYHGLLFDPTGACVEVPGQSQIPPGARVQSYPLVEKWKLLWIWMGDPSRADEGLIPNWFYIDHPDWVAAHGNDEKPLPMKCNWELNNDNLLDLSHFAYVHVSRLGPGVPGEFPVRTRRAERSVFMERFMTNQRPMPVLGKYFNVTGPVDRWAGSEITAPCHCIVDAGFAPPGKYKPGDARPDALGFRAMITATPETGTTSLMFYAQCRNFLIDNDEITRTFIADFRDLFLEDVAVMEGQQRVNSTHPGTHTIDINVDAPHLAMRQILRRLMDEERGVKAAAE